MEPRKEHPLLTASSSGLTLHIIPAPSDQGPSLHRIVQLDEPPSIDRLVRAVGGPLKIVPDFDSVLRGGEVHPCLAICNDLAERFELPQNTWANLLWLQALVRAHGFAEAKTPSALRGPVALVWGASEISLADLIEDVQG